MRLLITIGLLLTPFSTATNSGLPVISFGLPFLALAAAVGFLRPSNDAFMLVRSITPALLSAAAVVGCSMLFAFFAPFPDRSLARVAPHLICFVLACLLLARHRREPEELMRYVLRILAWSGAVLSLYFILHLAVAVATYGADTVVVERYTGGVAALPWGGSNVIAAPLIFPHVACLILRSRYHWRWSVPIMGLILLAAILTASRAGILIHGSMLLLGCVLLGRYRALGGWLVCFLLLLMLYARKARENLELLLSTRFSAERDLSNGRFESFMAKWEYITNNIMSPVGYYGSMSTFERSSHNIFLTVLVEQGLLGLACMLLFIGCSAYALFYNPHLAPADRDCRRLIVAGSGLAFANLLVEDANFTQPYMVYFWFFFLAVMAFAMRMRAAPALRDRAHRVARAGEGVWPA